MFNLTPLKKLKKQVSRNNELKQKGLNWHLRYRFLIENSGIYSLKLGQQTSKFHMLIANKQNIDFAF